MFNTPVLFLIFNRPELTERVFHVIKESKPARLFIAADGPRPAIAGEKEKCEKTRKIIEGIDWDCEVKTLFRDENMGCGKAVSSAINWFFEHVEQGIILEDDCLPDPFFFDFCDQLLNKYADNENIAHISGVAVQYGLKSTKASYFFSNIPHMWGWATWKRAWSKYDFEIFDTYDTSRLDPYWVNHFQGAVNGDVDTWDYQWVCCIFKNNALCITPVIPLVDNIGFDTTATHTILKPDWYFNEPLKADLKLIHPGKINVNNKADALTLQLFKGNLSIINRIRKKILTHSGKIKKML